MTTDTETNGDRLRAVLRKQGREATWLAKQVGMQRSQLSRFLRNEPGRGITSKNEEDIATALGFPTTQVFKVAP